MTSEPYKQLMAAAAERKRFLDNFRNEVKRINKHLRTELYKLYEIRHEMIYIQRASDQIYINDISGFLSEDYILNVDVHYGDQSKIYSIKYRISQNHLSQGFPIMEVEIYNSQLYNYEPCNLDNPAPRFHEIFLNMIEHDIEY